MTSLRTTPHRLARVTIIYSVKVDDTIKPCCDVAWNIMQRIVRYFSNFVFSLYFTFPLVFRFSLCRKAVIITAYACKQASTSRRFTIFKSKSPPTLISFRYALVIIHISVPLFYAISAFFSFFFVLGRIRYNKFYATSFYMKIVINLYERFKAKFLYFINFFVLTYFKPYFT